MPDAYTSILSGSPNGYAVNTVKTAYDLAFGMVLRETPAFSFDVEMKPTHPLVHGHDGIRFGL